MGRKAAATTMPSEAPALNEGAFEVLDKNTSELALVQAQHDSAVRAVAVKLGYQLPADCTDPDMIQRDISANMRRSVEACLEVGRGLVVLKTACGHGNFLARLDVLQLNIDVAARFMRSAAKFPNSPTSAILKAIGNQSKLFEMLCLDDEQINELELTGQTGELKLDDVATMSVKELRHALREERQNAETKSKLIADKDAKLNKLTSRKMRGAPTDWDDEVKAPIATANHLRTEIERALGSLDVLRAQAMDLTPDATGGDEQQLEKARAALGAALRDAMYRTREVLEALEQSFEATLGALMGE